MPLIKNCCFLRDFDRMCIFLRELLFFYERICIILPSRLHEIMLKKERQSFILRQVNLHNKVLSSDLSQEMKVSEDTIRRDLNELSDDGKVIKVHGGALSKSFHLSLKSPMYILLMKKRPLPKRHPSLSKTECL